MRAPKDESQNDPPEIIVKINGSRDYQEYLKRHKLKLEGEKSNSNKHKRIHNQTKKSTWHCIQIEKCATHEREETNQNPGSGAQHRI